MRFSLSFVLCAPKFLERRARNGKSKAEKTKYKTVCFSFPLSRVGISEDPTADLSEEDGSRSRGTAPIILEALLDLTLSLERTKTPTDATHECRRRGRHIDREENGIGLHECGLFCSMKRSRQEEGGGTSRSIRHLAAFLLVRVQGGHSVLSVGAPMSLREET